MQVSLLQLRLGTCRLSLRLMFCHATENAALAPWQKKKRKENSGGTPGATPCMSWAAISRDSNPVPSQALRTATSKPELRRETTVKTQAPGRLPRASDKVVS